MTRVPFKVSHFHESTTVSHAGKKRDCRVVLSYQRNVGMVSQLELLVTPQFLDTLRVDDVVELVNTSHEEREKQAQQPKTVDGG